MKSLASWLLTIFMVMFWLFRAVITVVDAVGGEMGFPIPNSSIEVILLFITLPLIVLVVKRIALAGLAYLIAYGFYFGTEIYKIIMPVLEGEQIGNNQLMNLFISTLAITLAFCVLADLVINKNRGNKLGDKKTDWFFKGEEYDRQFDERADRNNYKT